MDLSYQSVYLDQKTDKWQEKIVFHDPIFEEETTGIIALKSLRLENTIGFVVAAPLPMLRRYREEAKKIDSDGKLGQKDDREILDVLTALAVKLGIELVYLQNPHNVDVKAIVERLREEEIIIDSEISRSCRFLITGQQRSVRKRFWNVIDLGDNFHIVFLKEFPCSSSVLGKLAEIGYKSVKTNTQMFIKEYPRSTVTFNGCNNKAQVFASFLIPKEEASLLVKKVESLRKFGSRWAKMGL